MNKQVMREIKEYLILTRNFIWWWTVYGIPTVIVLSLPKKLRHLIFISLREKEECDNEE